ncbi:MAG: hypothetical protein QOJ22_635 [Thermoleophilaceae bacterium]|jgi:hypothetical protein|nr:hypothetical protein [Thermoleophilaceae bacterium]
MRRLPLDTLFHGGLALLIAAYVATPALAALYIEPLLGIVGWLTIPAAFYAARAWFSADRDTRDGASSVPAGRQSGLAALVAEVAPAGCEPPALFGVTMVAGLWIEPAPDGRNEDMLVIGLPLLAALPRPVLGALIARQLADRLPGGPAHRRWLMRRIAVLDAILEEVDSRMIVGVGPFLALARLFGRLALGRPRAEVPEDDPFARAAARVNAAFDTYWAHAVAPALERGMLPPIGEGFLAGLDHPELVAWLDEVIGDSAPLAGEPVELEDGRYLEVELVSTLRGADTLGRLEPVDWDEAFDTIEGGDDLGGRAAEPVATGSVRITLPRRRAALAIVGLVIVALLGLPVAAMCFYMPFALGGNAAAGVFGAAMGLLLTALLGWFAWTRTSLALREADVVWEGQRLTVKHPILREPLTLRAADLRVIATCADERAPRRFPVMGDAALELYGWQETGWLWTEPLGSPLPMLAVTPDAPNVALLFEHPIPAPRMRRQLLHGPLKGERMAGLLLHVDAPSALARVTEAWGLRQSVTEADAEAALELWHGEKPVAVPDA